MRKDEIIYKAFCAVDVDESFLEDFEELYNNVVSKTCEALGIILCKDCNEEYVRKVIGELTKAMEE